MSTLAEKKEKSIRSPINLDLFEMLSKFQQIEFEDVELSFEELELRLSPGMVAAPTVPAPSVLEKAKPTSLLEADFNVELEEYPAKIVEVKLGATRTEGGTRGKSVTIGGETTPAFHSFLRPTPNKPVIAFDVFDYPKVPLPRAVKMHFREVLEDPSEWARLCVEKFDAEMVNVHLLSIDPLIEDATPREAAKTVENVLQAVDVPVVVWGTANNQKDEEVLKKISEICQGKNLSLGPVEEGNHKGVGASAIGYGHTVVSSSPIDVNLAKQLNILLGNLGVPSEKTIIDPTTGGLGYGLEYSYSVMERIRMAALTQEDDKLQIPMISNVGNEVWKCKEVGQPIEDAPTIGDPERRGVLMESVAAVTYLLAGGDDGALRLDLPPPLAGGTGNASGEYHLVCGGRWRHSALL